MFIRIVKEVVSTTREGEICLGTQLGKRKQEHDPTLPIITKKLDGSAPYTRGTKILVRPKIKCGRYQQKGHKCQNCMLDMQLCHRFHQPGHFRANCTKLVIGMIQTLAFAIPHEEREDMCLLEKELITNKGVVCVVSFQRRMNETGRNN